MGNKVLITCLLTCTLFIFLNARWCCCIDNSPNNSTLRCKPYERAALLNFKHNVTYFNKNISSSWEGEECCNWGRVVCDNTTGHILELDLYGDWTNYLLKMEKLESMVYLLELRQLESLDLSHNDFSYSSIPTLMGSMKKLRYLSLSYASLGGLVPYELGNLTNLQLLDLSYNMLAGEIPASLGNLFNLKVLNLGKNNLSSITSSLRFPSNLESLDLFDNQLSGKIPTSLGNLSKLQTLSITNNPMEEFYADTCKINGQFPPWLQTQKNIKYLFLSDANIYGIMPSWFHTMQKLDWMDLSNNNLSGSPIFPINIIEIHLSNNSLSGEFLSNHSKIEVYGHAIFINLSDNKFSGPILQGLAQIMPYLKYLFLFNNQISGQIPNSLCQLTSLNVLDINNNSLSGEIPYCLAKLSYLSLVRLSYNKLKGHIPCFNNSESIHSNNGMDFFLHLNDNMLSGEIPSCLSDISNLKFLDIGGNQLSGKMLKWFKAEKFRALILLRLRGNKFSGTIPRQICSLPHLQLMDLGHNRFTGSIPRCLSNLTAMNSPSPYAPLGYGSSDAFSEVIQGIERAYTSTLPYLVDIDLSCNNLVGSIPGDMTKISGLLSLNLSYNQLFGTIPNNIGDLKKLISLDLSKNKLRGSIPTSIGEIYTLSHLNLSYNNLSGQVPTGNQLQVLSDQASIYAGNPYLCGDALPKKCKSKTKKQGKGTSDKINKDNKEKLKKMGFDMVVVSGFATGFWGVVGCLVLNMRWRNAFFQRVEDGYNWLYVIVILKVRVAKAKINMMR
ncbi:receptor-like protein EIX2 [Silene latifolia]|uniref:receptor-like protein EIX2 n=1 Tax=Silene latifolia TaxID=37657 RepID=UPI003D7851BC